MPNQYGISYVLSPYLPDGSVLHVFRGLKPRKKFRVGSFLPSTFSEFEAAFLRYFSWVFDAMKVHMFHSCWKFFGHYYSMRKENTDAIQDMASSGSSA